jgi:hypothetical protein
MQEIFKPSNVFSFEDQLNGGLVEDFRRFSANVQLSESILIHINSQFGTPTKLLHETFLIFVELSKKGVASNTHGKMFISGYMRMFLLGNHRTITNDSIGMIHLPVLAPAQRVHRDEANNQVEIVRNEIIDFFEKRTKLTRGEILLLDQKKITPQKMIEYGIAHEIISDLQTLIK